MSHPISTLIDTEADYRATMARIEAIFTARPGTPEGDELDRLVFLVEAYENKVFPIELPDSIAAIGFRMAHEDLKRIGLTPDQG